MTPKTGFDAAIERAQHLITLYELICDTRHRAIREDWASSFRNFMRWPANEALVRIDGKDRQSLLILRESCGIDRSRFAHEYLSELLRSAVVASVSALDRMLHDHVVKHSWKLLKRSEDQIPKELQKLSISALDARKAVEHLRKNPKARPSSIVKKALQETLHREFTFQNPDAVLKAAKMLGVSDFWGSVARKMPGTPSKNEIISMLKAITRRRNQIVHEADLIRTNRHEPSLRDISLHEASEWVDWMDDFGAAVDEVVADAL